MSLECMSCGMMQTILGLGVAIMMGAFAFVEACQKPVMDRRVRHANVHDPEIDARLGLSIHGSRMPKSQ
jgi:hypothetical protein